MRELNDKQKIVWEKIMGRQKSDLKNWERQKRELLLFLTKTEEHGMTLEFLEEENVDVNFYMDSIPLNRDIDKTFMLNYLDINSVPNMIMDPNAIFIKASDKTDRFLKYSSNGNIYENSQDINGLLKYIQEDMGLTFEKEEQPRDIFAEISCPNFVTKAGNIARKQFKLNQKFKTNFLEEGTTQFVNRAFFMFHYTGGYHSRDLNPSIRIQSGYCNCIAFIFEITLREVQK